MRFISTRIHGVLDYLMCTLLIVSPWIFGFALGGAETWVPVLLGAGGILYSLFTDYELGAVRKLSMSTHLTLDVLAGAFLAVSPWLFGFSEYVYLPHLILGLLEVGAGLFTKKTPDTSRNIKDTFPHGTTADATAARTNATIVEDTSRRPADRPTARPEADGRIPTNRDAEKGLSDREQQNRDRTDRNRS